MSKGGFPKDVGGGNCGAWVKTMGISSGTFCGTRNYGGGQQQWGYIGNDMNGRFTIYKNRDFMNSLSLWTNHLGVILHHPSHRNNGPDNKPELGMVVHYHY